MTNSDHSSSDLVAIDWNQVLQHLQSYATSELAREQLSLISPYKYPSEAEASFQRIAEARTIYQTGVRPFMESLDLYSTWYERLKKRAVLKTLELKDIRHFCHEVMALKELLVSFTETWPQQTHSHLMSATEPLSAIDQVMSPSGEILTDASEKLYNLTQEKKKHIQKVQSVLDKLVKAHQMETLLQDKYVTTREGRWVLPIRSGMQHDFEGVIHASSQSKQTVFMEPDDIVPMNNRLRQVEVEIEEEIERILKELSDYLYSLSREIEMSKNSLLKADVIFAQAQLSTLLDAEACEFSKNKLQLSEVRHPLLVLGKETPVSNTVQLDENKKILLLSGPNAGGKTVLLKSIGLAAHMARCGLHICAEHGSQLPFFTNFYIAVGDSQSVDTQLSTFAAHLQVLNQATKAKGSNQLLLIDEICGSTDPEEGSALARSFIDTYVNNDVFAIMTSHLGTLKKGWGKDSGVINGSLEYNNNKGPTYQFLLGAPGQSLAIKTAIRIGVEQKIIDKAYDYLSPDQKKYQNELQEVEKLKSEMSCIRDELKQQKKQMNKSKMKYESLNLQLEREKADVIQKVKNRTEKEAQEILKKIQVDKAFKRHELFEKIQNNMPEVVKASLGLQSGDDFAKTYPPGTKVYIPSLNRDGVIQSTPNAKGEVAVLSKSMRLSLPWEALKPPTQTTNPTQQVVRKQGHSTQAPFGMDRQVDLRGLKVEEALAKLENALDQASLQASDRVKVIHGHGTGVLKRSVRSYLSRSLYVKKWTAGTSKTGGDGMTWVEIK